MQSRAPTFLIFLTLSFALLAGCATKPPPDARGRWKPVNHYSEAPQSIPLQPAYVYYAAPLDRTLRGLLERWARDSRMSLDYRHDSDFTLHRPVAEVHANDLPAAVAAVAALYVPQHVAIDVEGDRLIVRRASTTSVEENR